MTPLARFVVIVLIVLGVVAIAVGIIYFAEPARSLPAFFPGHLRHGLPGRHTRRGIAAIVIGAVLLLAALVTERLGRRSSRI
jgi:hypothetical protein